MKTSLGSSSKGLPRRGEWQLGVTEGTGQEGLVTAWRAVWEAGQTQPTAGTLGGRCEEALGPWPGVDEGSRRRQEPWTRGAGRAGCICFLPAPPGQHHHGPTEVLARLPHAIRALAAGWGPARSQSVAGTSEWNPSERLRPFMWSPLLSTAGRGLVFHRNSQGSVSCLGDNCRFLLKG